MLVSVPSIVFHEVEPGCEYRASFTIKNKLTRPQRVRLAPLGPGDGTARSLGATVSAAASLPPGFLPFGVRFSPPQAGIAPGMTVPCEVTFRIPGTVARPLAPLRR